MWYNKSMKGKQNNINGVDIMKGFIKELENNPNGAYDYICNNYYKFSKEELKDIVKELLYAVYDNMTEKEHNDIMSKVAEELKEAYEEK